MCDPTYPIFRCAAVLESARSPTPAESVAIGRQFAENSAEFMDALSCYIRDTSKLLSAVKMKARESKDNPRIRLDPAVIIDFPVIQIIWQGRPVEMRVAITSWFGGRKCKLWIRANLLSEIREPGIVRRFFDEIKSECVNLREFCVSYFSNLTESLQLASTGLSLKKSYGIFIQMVSSGNAQLRKAIRKNLAAFGDDDRSEVEAKLLNVFHDEFGIGLPKREEASRYVKCYDYPLIDMRLINERIASRLRAADGAREQFDDTGSGTDEIISAAVFDAYDEFLDVWGIVYEDVPLRKHGITGPMVVSGELTLQLGSLY